MEKILPSRFTWFPVHYESEYNTYPVGCILHILESISFIMVVPDPLWPSHCLSTRLSEKRHGWF